MWHWTRCQCHISHVFQDLNLSLINKCVFKVACLLGFVVILGCTPDLNWREIKSQQGSVRLLMPCKPEQATRTVTLQANQKVVSTELHLQACEAGCMQFALGELKIPLESSPDALLDAWRLASLAALKAQPSQSVTQPRQVNRNSPMLGMQTRVETDQHQAQWAWFVLGNTIYQLGVYGESSDKKLSEIADSYFSGIELP